jgi:hypothetical protein
MSRFIKVVAALSICLASLLGYAETSGAQQNPVIAIDIALEPDQTMIQHAQAANARLLKAFPKGFALDATHHPHVTMLQQHMSAFGVKRTWTCALQMSAFDPKRTYVATSLLYHYGCTDRYSVIEICDVLVPHPETAG